MSVRNGVRILSGLCPVTCPVLGVRSYYVGNGASVRNAIRYSGQRAAALLACAPDRWG